LRHYLKKTNEQQAKQNKDNTKKARGMGGHGSSVKQ
jgi:hypothetical protein